MNNNLEQLRELMRSTGVEAVIIPGTDPHQSEYVSDYWKFRDWLSGFTGSNGTAVVTLRHASMWTDSRYFLQAGIELEDSGFELQNVESRGDLSMIMQWLTNDLHEDDTLAIDGRLFSLMDQFPDRFSIIDFYLSVCHRAQIVGCVKDDLQLMDVGKIETLDQAEHFINQI